MQSEEEAASLMFHFEAECAAPNHPTATSALKSKSGSPHCLDLCSTSIHLSIMRYGHVSGPVDWRTPLQGTHVHAGLGLTMSSSLSSGIRQDHRGLWLPTGVARGKLRGLPDAWPNSDPLGRRLTAECPSLRSSTRRSASISTTTYQICSGHL